MKHDISRTLGVFAINLHSGDVLANKKWKYFYDAVKMPKGPFLVGTLIGILLDLDRGMVVFYKDGEMLGIAACQLSLKYGGYFPFV
jgi:hypothetical protein